MVVVVLVGVHSQQRWAGGRRGRRDAMREAQAAGGAHYRQGRAVRACRSLNNPIVPPPMPWLLMEKAGPLSYVHVLIKGIPILFVGPAGSAPLACRPSLTLQQPSGQASTQWAWRQVGGAAGRGLCGGVGIGPLQLRQPAFRVKRLLTVSTYAVCCQSRSVLLVCSNSCSDPSVCSDLSL